MPIPKPVIIKPKPKKKKRIRRFLLFGLLILVLLTTFMYFYFSWRIKKELKDIEDLKIKNEQIRQEIKQLQSSESNYEELIRRRLGYIRDGEKIFIYYQNKAQERR
ncbi:MAG: FtsB family cell division protein [Thermodesulfobacteriaceae bacterium]|jgi:cell division protein FtsB